MDDDEEAGAGRKSSCELLGGNPHEGAHLRARKGGEKGLGGGVRGSSHPSVHPSWADGDPPSSLPPDSVGHYRENPRPILLNFHTKKCLSMLRNLENEKSGGGRHTGARAPPPDQEAVGCLDTHPRPLNMVSNFPSNHTPLPLGGGGCPRCR